MIYAIQGMQNSPIKIGYAINVEERVSLLQCGNPYLLKVLATAEGSRVEEMKMHAYCKPHRVRGEWFECNQQMIDVVSNFAETLAKAIACYEQIEKAGLHKPEHCPKYVSPWPLPANGFEGIDLKYPASLKSARQKASMSIAELSRKSGVSRDTIENVEAGRYGWRMDTFFALETALLSK